MSKTIMVVGGARGSIGIFISDRLEEMGHRVIRTTSGESGFCLRPGSVASDMRALDKPLNGIVFAHGLNRNDSLSSSDSLNDVINVNVVFILDIIRALMDRLEDGAAIVVIGSIYERMTRPGKLSYTVSKSALGGLVRSLACDPALVSRRMLINCVCPGPIDNEMTRRTLTLEQMSACRVKTGGRMVSEQDVWACVAFLLLSNTGINGQSIAVDLGMSGYLSL